MRENFAIGVMCLGVLLGGCVTAFLLGVTTNKDACFIAFLVLFFASLLLTAVLARTNTAARWLLAVLVGLTLLMGVQYFSFLYYRASLYQELMKEEIRAAPVQQAE